MSLDRKLKIVYVVARFHPFKGGAEQNAYQLATRMAAAGHDVKVLTTDTSPTEERLPRTEHHRGVQIIRSHNWNRQIMLGFNPRLLVDLLRTDADAIHCENGPGIFWQEFCLAVKRIASRNTKFVVTPHGPLLATPGTHRGLRKGLAYTAKLLLTPYYRLVWKRLFHLVIQVNPQQHLWLKSKYGVNPDRVRLLPNGISENIIVDHKPNLGNDQVVVTYVGRISEYKGVQDVIEAMALLPKDTLHKTKFIAMGKPEAYLQPLKHLIMQKGLANRVEIIPSPSDRQRDHILLNQSQIFILPSRWEATGIVLIEAMAKGNAIITTTANEAAEIIIEQGDNGFIYKPGEAQTLAIALEQLINDPRRLADMINLNLKLVHRHTWESIFPKYLDIIAEVINDRN